MRVRVLLTQLLPRYPNRYEGASSNLVRWGFESLAGHHMPA